MRIHKIFTACAVSAAIVLGMTSIAWAAPATPTANVQSGTVAYGTQVYLSCSTPNVTIVYTTNGSEPRGNQSANRYTSPIVITSNVTIKAAAYDTANEWCVDISSYTYTVDGSYSGTISMPQANPPSGSNVSNGTTITLTSSTANATISYTTDQSDPRNSPTRIQQTAPVTIQINGATRIYAVARDSAGNESSVATFEYNVSGSYYGTDVQTSVTPGTVSYGTQVYLSTNYPNSTIYYTLNGSSPTTSSTRYYSSSPIIINSNTRILAVAVDGYGNYSSVSDFNYTVSGSSSGAVTASPAPGNVSNGTKVYLTAGSNTTIYFTTNGSTPTQNNGTRYYSSSPITISGNTRIMAVAIDSYGSSSSVSTFDYTVSNTKTAAPTANIASGTTITAGTKVTLSSATSNSTIYFTFDGTNPSSSSTRSVVSGPLTINSTVTLYAIAVAPGYSESDRTTLTYTVQQAATPTPRPTLRPTATPVPAGAEIKITIGSRQYTKNNVPASFDVAPYIETDVNRTMVPIRFIAEALGADVVWDDARKTDYITLRGRALTIVLNQELPNGMGKASIVQDRLFVPVRYVSEQLGARVNWDPAGQIVTINQ
jgi:hypothetical protein